MNPRVYLVHPELPVSPPDLISEYAETFVLFQNNKGPPPGCFLFGEA